MKKFNKYNYISGQEDENSLANYSKMNEHIKQDLNIEAQLNSSLKPEIRFVGIKILYLILIVMVLLIVIIICINTTHESPISLERFTKNENIQNQMEPNEVKRFQTNLMIQKINQQPIVYQQTDNVGDYLKQNQQDKQEREIILPAIVKNSYNVIAIFICEGRLDILIKTLKSFMNMNSYPISSIIVAIDKSKSRKINSLTKKFSRITWKIINFDMGQLAVLDELLINLESNPEYLLYMKDHFYFNKIGFIEAALQIFEKQPNVSQVLLTNFEGFNHDITLMDTLLAGFNLMPSLYSFKALGHVGGFSNFTKNITYGKSAELADIILSMYYIHHGYHISVLTDCYLKQTLKTIKPLWNKLIINENILKKKSETLTDKQKNYVWFVQLMKDANNLQVNYVNQVRLQLNSAFYLETVPSTRYGQIILSEIGADKNIQVGSKLDYLGLEKTKKFQLFRHRYEKNFTSTSLIGGKGIPNKRFGLILQKIKNFEEAETYMNSKIANNKTNFYFGLATKLLQNSQNQKQLIEAEYVIYNQTYNFEKQVKNLQLCVFVEGFNLFTKSNYHKLLQSISNQNFSEYRLVIIDDASSDNSYNQIYNLIQKSYPFLYSKLQVVSHNNQRLYTSGNLQAKVKKYCWFSDVVINIGPNTHLIGKQAFNVINSVFQDQNTWMALFPSLETKVDGKLTYHQIQNIMNIKTSNQSIESYLKVYRYKLCYELPIQSSLYFERNGTSGYLIAKYQQTNKDIFQIYPYLQMSGVERIKLADQFISFYKQFPSELTCGNDYELYIQTKAKTKTAYKQLQYLGGKPQITNNYEIPEDILILLKQQYQKYRSCLARQRPSLLLQPKFKPKLLSSQTIQYGKIGELVKKNVAFKSKPLNIFGINSFIPIQELPFCLIMKVQNNTNLKLRNQIIASITNLRYSNYITLFFSTNKTEFSNFISSGINSEYFDYQIIEIQYITQKLVRQMIKFHCVENSLIMYINWPLNSDCLVNLNKIHQTSKSWITISQMQESVHIHSFYSRLYDFVPVDQNSQVLIRDVEKENQQIVFLAFFQLCLRHRTFISIQNVYNIQNGTQLYTTILVNNKTDEKMCVHQFYPHLLSLNEHFSNEEKVKEMQKQYSIIYRDNHLLTINKTQITYEHLLQSLDYQQAYYLPLEHNIHKRQRLILQRIYNIRNNLHKADTQLRFCFTIILDESISEQQMLKTMSSILRQNYSNFHVVIMDDSIEQVHKETIVKIREMVQKLKLSIGIRYIKNKEKKYVGYNVLHAAFNYCQSDDIQMYINGSFELIGKEVLNVFNWGYLNNENNYIVYSNYKKQQYSVGQVTRIMDENYYTGFDGRKKMENILEFTSWKVKLIKSIPLKYHMMTEKFQWFKLASLEALNYALIEQATAIHSEYLPYIAYQKIELSMEGMEKTKQKQEQLASLLKLVPIQVESSISQSCLNPEVANIFSNNENVELVVDINL